MDEVDNILIHTLRDIGCHPPDSLKDVSNSQLMECVLTCLRLMRPEETLPAYDSKAPMAIRYKVAATFAEMMKEMGYNDEIGCQSFLYPTEIEVRKILIYLIENLPKDDKIGDKVYALVSKFAAENKPIQLEDEFSSDVMQIGGIKFPRSVDVDKLPKETLKFYASHLADLSFEKQRQKYRTQGRLCSDPRAVASDESSQSEDDFGHDEDVEPTPRATVEKPAIKPKPKCIAKSEGDKVQTIEENNSVSVTLSSDIPKAETSYKSGELINQTEELVKLLKLKEKQAREAEKLIERLREKDLTLEHEINMKKKRLERLENTNQLLQQSNGGILKIKEAIDGQVQKLLALGVKWDSHRKPLVEEIISAKSIKLKNAHNEPMRDRIEEMRNKIREMNAEATRKEEALNLVAQEYERLPKDVNRSFYTKRIIEIIGNIKKQKKEINKVLGDTKEVQREINVLSGKIDRTFAIAEELIYKDASRDDTVALIYKSLVSMHSESAKIIKSTDEMRNLKRQAKDMQDKLGAEREKNVLDKFKRLQSDLDQMASENQMLEACLRNPLSKS